MSKSIKRCGWALLMLVSLSGCWSTSADSDKPKDANLIQVARDESLGPDVCKIQFWAARAMAQATGRTPEQAVYDRAAWNLAQIRVAAMVDADPQINEEQAVADVAKALTELYQSAPPTECKTGK